MKKTLFLLLVALMTISVSAQDQRFNDLLIKTLPNLSVNGTQGVSAPFVGQIDNAILVAGGCNFPDTPAAEGGQKVFYDDIYILPNLLENSGWKKIGTLARPLAYGVCVNVSDGLVCIGGTSDGLKSESSVFLIQYKNGNLEQKDLPALPIGLDQMAGAYGDGYIYIVGGQTDGVGQNGFFRLRYPDTSKGWERLTDFPGDLRVQPSATIQSAALGPQLYVFGGYDPVKKLAHTDGLTYNLKTGVWQTISAHNGTFVGATAVPSGCGHILLFGGVNKDIFESAIQEPQSDYLTHPVAWYHFNDEIAVYSTVTDAWTSISGDSLLARAGAGVVSVKDNLGQIHWVLVNGEEKPGVRANTVTDVQMTYTARFGWLNWAVLLLYLLGMIMLGVYFMRRQ